MRPRTLYDLLEVHPEASADEITRAYQLARATYEPNSLATYSIFSEEESLQILRRVEEAYEVLADSRRRREYDTRLRQEIAEAEPAVGAAQSATSLEAAPAAPAGPSVERVRDRQADLELEQTLEPEDGVYDGSVLRRIRVSRGVEIEEISEVTKINPVYLRLIEQNRFNELPAPVYLRGFLRQYARCLRLDPARVTESYMERCAATRVGSA